ncbi:hypothetical protein MDA_GLEAN10014393 [Myotis davidii]|uniref:Uncharacterized protein n=1 Tax=Myotis davidii TaxID=225400 RepID=L5LVE6_MYODS|nr:hypothetical protein MDA_GLEAN10014393 [Myotis davidii]
MLSLQPPPPTPPPGVGPGHLSDHRPRPRGRVFGGLAAPPVSVTALATLRPDHLSTSCGCAFFVSTLKFSLQFASFSAYPGSRLLYKETQRDPHALPATAGRRRNRQDGGRLSECESPPTQGGGRRHVTRPRLAPPPSAVPDGRQSSERGRRPFCVCFLWDAVVAVGSEE